MKQNGPNWTFFILAVFNALQHLPLWEGSERRFCGVKGNDMRWKNLWDESFEVIGGEVRGTKWSWHYLLKITIHRPAMSKLLC